MISLVRFLSLFFFLVVRLFFFCALQFVERTFTRFPSSFVVKSYLGRGTCPVSPRQIQLSAD